MKFDIDLLLENVIVIRFPICIISFNIIIKIIGNNIQSEDQHIIKDQAKS